VSQGHGGGPDARHAAVPIDEAPRRRRWPWLLLLLLLVLGGWAGWLLYDAGNARMELNEASVLVTTLEDQVIAGDREGATQTLHELQTHAQAARDITQGVHWKAAGLVPWVGPNVEAVRTLADVLNNLSTTALPELMDATEIVDPAALAPASRRWRQRLRRWWRRTRRFRPAWSASTASTPASCGPRWPRRWLRSARSWAGSR
jgi:hypothetical protein